MKTATIEELAYHLKRAKKNGKGAIFFIGAGASKTGGIPLAGEIIEDILKEHKDNPEIKKLSEEDKKNYALLMNKLTANERNELLRGYIEKAKINVTHIYLASMLINGFVDYILSVNFDNLMLRALALFNIFQPVYDMAILKDLTTTTPKEKSVIYLHGQHHGLWLLNTPEETEKVRNTIPPIFHSIKNERPWVILGYSADNDPVFEHIKNLGRFDNRLFWVTYKNNLPCTEVKKFLNAPIPTAL